MEITILSNKVILTLTTIVFILLVANCLGIISTLYFDHPTVFGLVRLFSFNQENNIPTFYSSTVIAMVSVLLCLIGFMHKKLLEPYKYWWFLSFFFFFLAIDEAASIHEMVGHFIYFKMKIEPSSLTQVDWVLAHASWTIPYGLLVIIFFAFSIKFLQRLRPIYSVLFIVSGIIFVFGAIGFEILNAIEVDAHDRSTLTYHVYYTLEEFFEMLGILVFIYALVRYLRESFESFRVIFKP